MSIIIKLQGLPLEATSIDVRHYFLGLTIPDGGVHIVGGDEGTVFIEFASDEDARQAMARGDGTIKDSSIKLLLSSRAEMQSLTEIARQQQQKYFQQQQQQQPQQHNQQQPQQNLNLHQQTISQQQSFAPSGLTPMGPAMLPTQQLQQQSTSFEGDPRILSQNYQGMLNVINQSRLPKNQSQPLHQQPPQLLPQQSQTQTSQPSSFADPRILSQNYQTLLPGLTQGQTQPLLPQQGQIFNQFPPTTIATSNSNLNLSLLGGVGVAGGPIAPMALNPLNAVGAGVGSVLGNLNLAGQTVAGPNLTNNSNNNNSNNNGANNVAAVGAGNRNHSPDNRARMSGMRGGDDKLFANKRCVLAATNLPYRATSKDIIEFLSEFNIKEDCIRRRYNQKGQPTADAKIAFPTPDAAMKAMKMMNKKNLCGRPVFFKPV